MIVISYPDPSFRVKKEHGKEYIFDQLRKKWLILTPEEWVRQNFIQYLLGEKKYPAALIALEKEINLGELKKRFDILVYDSLHRPWLMVECKSMEVKLGEEVLQQVLRYTMSAPVSFIIITNGTQTKGWEKRENNLFELNDIPQYQ
jgi:hypothetical protein